MNDLDPPPPQEWASPPTSLAIGPDELHVWRVPLAARPGTAHSLAVLLSPDERERAARFVLSADRTRFIVARAALRQLLGAYLGVAPTALRLAYSALGKPYLVEPVASLAFNLAHSGELALVAVAWERRVGVDVELMRDDLQYMTMMTEIFTAREQQALVALPEGQRLRAFFDGWTRKEAYLKARGDGLSLPPTAIEIDMTLGAREALRLPPDDAGGPWSLVSLDPEAGYTAAVAIEGEPAALRLYAAPSVLSPTSCSERSAQ